MIFSSKAYAYGIELLAKVFKRNITQLEYSSGSLLSLSFLSVDTIPIRIEPSYNHKDRRHILGIEGQSEDPSSLLIFSNRHTSPGVPTSKLIGGKKKSLFCLVWFCCLKHSPTQIFDCLLSPLDELAYLFLIPV